MLFDRILKVALPEAIIPKPKAIGQYRVKGIGTRRNERALVYYIPNHNNPARPYQKGVTVSEFQRAYEHLQTTGELSHQWFNQALPQCAAEGSCNFTTIGGIFILLGEARYADRGIYVRVDE